MPDETGADPTVKVTTVVTDVVRSKPSPVEEVEKPILHYTKTDVNMREGPGTKFAVIKVVRKGVEISVLEAKGGWSRVRVDENTSGWMASSTMVKR